MKNFKKLIREAHLGNPLNENKKPKQLNIAVVAGTDYIYSVKVEFEDGSTEKFGSEKEAKEKYNLDGIPRQEFEMDVSESVNEDLIKEITLAGGDYSDSYGNNQAEEQLTTTEDYEIFMELFPQGEASRILMDPKRKELYDQHLEWTKDNQYNNTFEHMQFHLINHDGEDYKVHQTQYYNGNYKDFRNPRFTELMI